MTNKSLTDSSSIAFKNLKWITGIYENQSMHVITCNNVEEDINNNIKESNSNIGLDLSIKKNDDEISHNPQEWMISDVTIGKRRAPRQHEFLLLLLKNPNYSSYINWTNRNPGEFFIHKPEQVAKLWRKVKHRQTTGNMDYETFARGLRFYYKSGLMMKTHKKHTFRFKLPFNSVY